MPENVIEPDKWLTLMIPTFEELYLEIGRSALSSADDLRGKLLVYSEFEDGVVSADVFYEDASGNVRFRFGQDSLQECVYSFWTQWKEHSNNSEWHVMCYAISGVTFDIDLIYPDQISGDEDLSDRRPRAIKKYFGDARIDYSRP